jgi:DNA-binding PadR family transcriptional regulator
MPPRSQRSALALLVLWQLVEGPAHPYRLHKLLLERGKERVVNVRSRASLYQVLERLLRLGLVEVHETVRGEAHPDRVVYAISDKGREVAQEWLRETLRSTGPEFPDFIAAVSIMFALDPEDTRAQLELREAHIAADLQRTDESIANAPAGLPRLFLLEDEYRRAMLQAELEWLGAVIADLNAGRLTWSEEWLQQIAQDFAGQDDQEEGQ